MVAVREPVRGLRIKVTIIFPLDPVTSFQGSTVTAGLSAKVPNPLYPHKPFDSIRVLGDYLKGVPDLAGMGCDGVLSGTPGLH
jgi:hypothetical protein